MFKGEIRILNCDLSSLFELGISNQFLILEFLRLSVSSFFSLIELRYESKHCSLFQTRQPNQEVWLRYFNGLIRGFKQLQHVFELSSEFFCWFFTDSGTECCNFCYSLPFNTLRFLVECNPEIIERFLPISLILSEHCCYFMRQSRHQWS